MTRLIAVAGLVLLAVLSASSCSSKGSPPAALYSPRDAVKVTAQQLYSGYSDHTKTSDKSYKGKLLEVIGVIHSVGTDPILNAPEVMLSGGVTNQDRGIDCTFDTRYASQIAKLHEGQTTTVLGVCDGFAVNVVLLHCQPASK